MGVIGGHAIRKHRDGKFPHTAPDQLAILISIADELEEELSIMATMRQMIELSRQKITIGPWHETTILPTSGIRLQARSGG